MTFFSANLGIVIPYRTDHGHRERLLQYNISRLRSLVPDAEIVIQDSKYTIFNRAEARNVGVSRLKKVEYLLLLDADTLFNYDQIERGVEAIENGAPWIIAYDTYCSMTESASAEILNHRPDLYLGEPEPGKTMFKLKSFAGVLLMRKEVFHDVGGYDERFEGWGYEDNAFKDKMDTLHGPFQRVRGNAYHLWHPRSEEENFGQPNIKANEMLYNRYGKAKGNKQAMGKLANECK